MNNTQCSQCGSIDTFEFKEIECVLTESYREKNKDLKSEKLASSIWSVSLCKPCLHRNLIVSLKKPKNGNHKGWSSGWRSVPFNGGHDQFGRRH